jgi:hypothetical protein
MSPVDQQVGQVKLLSCRESNLPREENLENKSWSSRVGVEAMGLLLITRKNFYCKTSSPSLEIWTGKIVDDYAHENGL